MKVTINAPAKINLYLNILNKLDNGYHNVEMIMQTVSLFDKVTVSKDVHSGIKLSSNHTFPGVIEKNTAYLAAQAFFEKNNLNNLGINIHIEKKIPIGAGLAGGSTDAAAVLVALNHLFSTHLSKCDLALIGRKVGADVPFCVLGGTMLADGIGTTLAPLVNMPDCHIIIVKPETFVSTKAAYTASDKFPINKNKTINSILSAIKNHDIEKIANGLYNRFEVVMSLSEIDKIKNILNKHGAINSCMTGTGSAVFGIFDNKESANTCKSILSSYYKEVFLVNPITHGCYISEK